MRVGVLTRGDVDELKWARGLGFRSVEWIRFDESPCSIEHTEWEPHAQNLNEHAKSLGLRISAIGAFYKNPLDPKQSKLARAIFQRAIEAASHLGIRTVSGFAGAVIEPEIHPRGGNPVYKPFEQFIPELIAFWEPIARFAADHGVRIAFEHCPQGPFHLPIMHYNMMGQPAIWEKFFSDCRAENIGIEWDASHLICQFIDPVANIHKFGSRIFHVHAKDAFINRPLLEQYGICHPGVAEHRFPGLGQANWAEIVHALLRAGYDSDLNIEGWHDPVYRDYDRKQPADVKSAVTREPVNRKLEEAGLLIARKTLEFYTERTE
jgi:sugar phosphate isomerase/epimerase